MDNPFLNAYSPSGTQSMVRSAFPNTTTSQVPKTTTAQRKTLCIEYIDDITRVDMWTIDLSQAIDEFTYPPLEELRKQFELTGLYSKEKIDEIIKVY